MGPFQMLALKKVQQTSAAAINATLLLGEEPAMDIKSIRSQHTLEAKAR